MKRNSTRSRRAGNIKQDDKGVKLLNFWKLNGKIVRNGTREQGTGSTIENT